MPLDDGGTSTYWSGLNWLRLNFKGDLPSLDIREVENPMTVLGREPVRYAPEVGQGIGWSRYNDYLGDVDRLGESLSAGSYAFTFTAPVGSNELNPNRLHDLIVPSVYLTQMVKGIPEENPTGSGSSACWRVASINKIEPGSLRAFGSTTLKATTKSVTWRTKPSVTVTVTSAEGIPTGDVNLTGPRGIKSRATLVQKGATGQAVLKLPATLPVGTHRLSLTYAGHGQHSGSSATVNLKVTKRKPSLVLRVTKKPQVKTKGKATLTVKSPLTIKPSGKVTVTLKKGRSTKKVTGTLRGGKVTVSLPKLATGRWTVKARYAGDPRYAVATASAPKITSR